MIWEDTVLVYSYIRASAFLEQLERLRAFLHRLGSETDQGEVVVEFGDSMYHITEFDPEAEVGVSGLQLQLSARCASLLL